ncbi:MAG: hypothetical protein IK078_07335 [Lachnospiraceae bacterium]|nr:hypothetical protein [Lachnospiraceae bacterium]
MQDKTIKIPMIAGIILQGIAVLIGIIAYVGQIGLGSIPGLHITGKVFPDTLATMTITLLMHIVCLLVVQTSQGQSNRTYGIIMVVVYCAVNILSTYVARIATYFETRNGAEYIAAKSVLASTISMLTSPLCFVSLALVLIAIGRYGVSGQD